MSTAMRGLILAILAWLSVFFAAGCESSGSGLTLVPTASAEGACRMVTVTCAIVIATCLVVLFRGRSK